MSRIVCYRCLMLPVVEAGELCKRCHEGWEPPRRKNPKAMPPLEEWTVEMLIETQDAGTVPGEEMRRRHESTFTELGIW